MKKITLLTLAVILLASCAKNYYVNPQFEDKTRTHTVVAILPYKMINTGKQPKNMTQQDLEKLEEAESVAFQTSLYDQILKSTRGGKKPFRVEFQSVNITNSKLKEQGISIRESWDKDPTELAKLLGVDAVAKSSVQKNRYLSDLASFGIDVGTSILEGLTGLGGATPMNATKTNDVRLSCDLINATDAATLYNLSRSFSVDWTYSTQQVIEDVNRRISRTFPYRIEK